MITFKLIGASGYIAERHFNAIKNIGGNLTHIYDLNDSCGAIDKYFLGAKFCDSEDDFFNVITDYTVICTPNHLHFRHMRSSRKCRVICEKPLVLNVNALQRITDEANCILQLRYMDIEIPRGDLLVEYYSPRGDWYYKSWKGDKSRSGGIATNIGIHIFDLLCYHLGEPKSVKLEHKEAKGIIASIEFKDRICKVILSTDPYLEQSKRTIKGDNKTVDLSKNFTELHTKSYKEILAGRGFTPKDCLPSLKIAEALR